MRVLKFGGTSLKNAERFLLVTNIVSLYLKDEKIAVVLSAPATITNILEVMIEKSIKKKNYEKDIIYIEYFFINLINNLKKRIKNLDILIINNNISKIINKIKKLLYGINLINNCPDIIKAKILSQGEKFSIILLKYLLKIRKYEIFIISPKKYLLAYGNYLESTVDISITFKNIQKINLLNIDIILMPGFSAVNKKNEIVLLGRNGSDYSAAVLAVCLKAKCCEIWTDVDGMHTADPNIISNTKLLKFITYKEAITLSYFGAKVIHYKTLAPMLKNNIPCIIKNIMNSKSNGTLINNFNINQYSLPKIKGITELKNISMLNISGDKNKQIKNIIARILFFIFKLKMPIYFITQSSEDCNINIFLLNKNLNTLKLLLEEEFYLELKCNLIKQFKIIQNLSLITLVNNKINYSINIISKFLNILKITKTNILAISQNIFQNYITVAIQEKYAKNIIKITHKILFHKKKILEIFIIGTGSIGSTLLQQIYQNKHYFKNKNINLKICSILNTKYSLINLDGLDIKNWKKEIKYYFNNNTIENLLQNFKKYKFINPVIIDCTSSQKIADQYINFLNYGFNIIAVNKKANSSTLEYYNQIRFTARKLNLKFFYETNVGAGLPVVNTLQNLLKTGDQFNSFIGILSGSLSFIFGKLEEGITLSKSIIMAQKMGFTEPDPRIDLTGIDVARKLLILAREIGFNIELNDINIESIIPNNIFNKKNSIKEFLNSLSDLDIIYEKKIKEAQKKNKVLRYIGSINSKGICKIKIIKIDNNHPFFKIKDGENSFAFYTNYYQPYPLILRGYGAGNNVTAAGVLTDLLRLI
ncbi:bifunctional aspartate kinase/homoserine dehydrogenase I [Enterobacteriaceae endosymbiont of Donacia sparganii]|uniref:bifunctional aspartate kinase/homoserine dehydrogenase I n=1 Tax=Enterobacteriaceae endosymbiont of Donacia sparganii TaxID=2675785 RepID=UPI001448F3F3|nr:bifunctional aspartate kinase/homoserine dehydrogenase I [Enterobacteriaceae endosymbiont of Donacia sparganii]QJC35845.1 bifunctional aspartate kinase/homoserine dehydrogenase I [Enterobacteriaceae endosymbiont of Donacia sparganii]